MADRYDEIRARWRRSGADRGWDNTTDCVCPDEPHQNALHVLADEDVPWLLARVDELRKLADLLTEQGDETGADIRVILAGGEVADD